MAEEEVVAPSASPTPSDYKRKFEDLGPQQTESNANSEPDTDNVDAAVSDDADNKRPRLDDNLAVANENGHKEEHVGEAEKETVEGTNLESGVSEDGQPLPKDFSEEPVNEQAFGEVAEPADAKEVTDEDPAQEEAEELSKETQEPSESTVQDVSDGDKQPDFADKHDASPGQKQLTSGAETTTRKIEVPNNKASYAQITKEKQYSQSYPKSGIGVKRCP